jgi:hypothetical protein
MDAKSLVVSTLSLYSYREGNRLAPGSRDAMMGIAFVIANRVKAGWHDGDWLKALSQAPRHSASESQDMLTHDMPDIWDQTWRWLVGNVEKMYDGNLNDNWTLTPSREAVAANIPGGERNYQQRPSFFYANLNMPIRPWFLEKIIRSTDHPRTVEIPPVVFFN